MGATGSLLNPRPVMVFAKHPAKARGRPVDQHGPLHVRLIEVVGAASARNVISHDLRCSAYGAPSDEVCCPVVGCGTSFIVRHCQCDAA